LKDLVLHILQDEAIAASECPQNGGGGLCLRSERAARWGPAGPPSVGAPPGRTSSSASERFLTPGTKLAVSLLSRRRSVSQTSTTCPRARRRASARGGSTRLARIRCRPGGR